MYIEFEESRDSVAAFANDYVATSAHMQRQIRRARLVFGLVLLPWGLAYFLIGRPYSGVVLSLLPVILIVLWPRFVAFQTRRSLIRSLEGGKLPPWKLGLCRLELDSGKLAVIHANSQSRVSLRALEALHETPTHVFIYMNPNEAITISRSQVLSGDLNRFVSELKEQMAAA